MSGNFSTYQNKPGLSQGLPQGLSQGSFKTVNTFNNCGKHGHLFHQCCLPITSCGIIAFTNQSSNSGLQYLMIRRKDGFGYIEFIRGKYSLSNIEQIQNIIDEMSVPEKQRILKESFETLRNLMWGGRNNQYKQEETMAQKKFEALKTGIIIDDEFITLDILVANSTTAWKETEWEFPKGRRNYQEKDIECALREFAEETGCPANTIELVDNLQPFEETFIGSNYKAYKHKYYLAKLVQDSADDLVNNADMQHYQKTEVSEIQWKTCEECLRDIRPYNLEKKQLIANINAMLLEYRTY